jgi:serine/threonine protein kinase
MNLKISSVSDLKEIYRQLGIKGFSKINKKNMDEYILQLQSVDKVKLNSIIEQVCNKKEISIKKDKTKEVPKKEVKELKKEKDKKEVKKGTKKPKKFEGWDGYLLVESMIENETHDDNIKAIINEYKDYIKSESINKCNVKKISKDYSNIEPSDFDMIKVGMTVESNYNCKMVIKKILLVQTNTAVFIVDVTINGKVIPKVVKISTSKSKQIQREEKVHLQSKHSLYEFTTTPIKIGDKIFRGVIMDYLGKPINSSYVLKYVDKRKLFNLMLKELETLHKYNILHQDIKPDNILYDEIRNKVNIIDYGLSQIINENIPYEANGGTPSYSSPYIDLDKVISKTYRQHIPTDYYKDNKSSDSYITTVYSVRAYDDIISIIYVFISFYVDNMVSKFIKNITEYDKQFVKKYGNRRSKHFKLLKPKTPIEEMYKLMFNLENNEHTTFRSPSFDSSQRAKIIGGSMSKELLNKILTNVRIVYKLKYFPYDSIKNKLPKWLNDFIEPYKKDMFNVDIENKLKVLEKLVTRYNFKNMTKEQIIKVSGKYGEFYDPLYTIEKYKI